jgi:hypothetical protein
MKHSIPSITLIVLCTLLSHLHATDDCNVILKSKWYDLDNNYKKTMKFGGKWILVGSITFLKKSKDYLSLDNITLEWQGEKLDNLTASLYRKNLDKDFLPIEDNLVCDGIWNKKKQTLIFNFNEKEYLAPRTVFYLVLTIPEIIEPVIKKGTFCLEGQCLPRPFKHCAGDKKLSLAINESMTHIPGTSLAN